MLNQNKQTKRSKRVVIRNIQLPSFLYSYPSTSPSIKKSNSLNKEHFDLALYSKIKKKKKNTQTKEQAAKIKYIWDFSFLTRVVCIVIFDSEQQIDATFKWKAYLLHIYKSSDSACVIEMFYNSELYEINFYSMLKSSVVGN